MFLNGEINEVIKIINNFGEEAYLVGGAVRDKLLKREVSDFDLATSARPEKIIKIFKEYPKNLVGKKYGTVLINYKGYDFEITSFRKDLGMKDGRKPSKVIFTDNLLEDLKRRDFTINAMAYNNEKGLIDPFNGQLDLKKGLIVTVGDPNIRFKEDYLRILRCIRFASELDFSISEMTYKACVENRDSLKHISRERIRDEFFKIVLSDNSSKGLNILKDSKILEIIMPELYKTVGFNQRSSYHLYDLYKHSVETMKKTPRDLSIRLAALFHDIGKLSSLTIDSSGEGHFYGHEIISSKMTDRILKSLNTPKAIRKEVKLLITNHMVNYSNFKNKGYKRLICKFEENNYNICKLLKLQEADRKARGKNNYKIDDINFAREQIKKIKKDSKQVYRKKELAIDGNIVIELGYKEGKIVGEILDYLYNIVLEYPELNTRSTLIKLINYKYIDGRESKVSKLFGTDGIRGIANKDLTPELAFKVGKVTAYLLSKEKGAILIGKDTRISGDMIESALIAGITSLGVDIIQLGVVPTPAVAYLTRKYEGIAGIVISASHNPGEYNGIKIFNSKGLKLTDSLEEKIEKLVSADIEIDEKILAGNIGRVFYKEEAADDYLKYLLENIKIDLKGKKIAMDCGNGALFKIGPRAIELLNGELIAINIKPDGMNINDNCGSTNPNLIQDLVKSEGADIGLSFDGDGDRIIAVDNKGDIIDGDHILAICASYLKEKNQLNHDVVVGTIMSNMGLDDYLTKAGMKIVRTPVGDRYVLEEMVKNNYSLGGEQSGHIIIKKYNTTGDGLATALKLLKISIEKNKSLAELNGAMENYPQVLVNARVKNENKYKYSENKKIMEEIKKVEDNMGEEGRVIIRPSGTEPLVRVMIEAKEGDNIKKIAEDLAIFIEKEIG